jgi:hypothetical protein
MKKVASKYFTNKEGETLKKDLLSTVDARLQGEITKLKYELKDEQTKFLSEMHDMVDGLASEVRDNRDFRDITTNQIIEDRERIGKLEKKVFGVVSLS